MFSYPRKNSKTIFNSSNQKDSSIQHIQVDVKLLVIKINLTPSSVANNKIVPQDLIVLLQDQVQMENIHNWF